MGNNNCTCCCAHGNAQPDKQPEHTGFLKDYGRILLSAALLFSGIILKATGMEFFADDTVMFAWYLAAYLPVGLPVLKEAWESILQKDIFSEFTLMSIATLGAFYIKEYPEGVAVMLFYSLGELFQERAVSKAKRNISALIDVRPETATVIKGNETVVTSPRHVQTGDIIEVKTGERVPLDGKMLDDNTYAGVLRIPVEDMTVDDAGWTKFYEVRNAFFKEKGIDVDSEDFSFDKLAQTLGMDEYSDENLPQVGGPAISDYVKDIKVPDRFAMELDLKDIVGTLPDDQDTTPDIPQDLRDEYNQKMAEHGISTDDADYESLTEEQKDLEHQFFTEMWNEYFERYPEAIEGNNRYNSWTLKGDWKFNVDVEKNTSDTVKKDVNVVDENGDGVLSITKTPFEITMKMQDPEAKYFAVMLDANGDIMPYRGVSNSNNTYAIQDRDISTVYIYLCDYYEYMDELKGYYWSDDYEEKAKTRTFKQLLDERAVAGTEVHFDTDK